MKCIINNPNCYDGWEYKNKRIEGKCGCVLLKAVNKAYDDFGGFNKQFKKTLKQLEDNNVRTYSREEILRFDTIFESLNKNPNNRQLQKDNEQLKNQLHTQSMQELGKKMIKHFKDMTDKQAKIVIFGDPGTGKSQFVSSIAYEIAYHHKLCSYYLEASELANAVFDFSERGKEKLRKIEHKVNHEKTRCLIIDDIGSELAKGTDNRMGEMLTVYNRLIRDFFKKENVVLMMTSNFKPWELSKKYEDKRLFDVVFQNGKTKFYEFSAKNKFRQKAEEDELDFLD